MRSARPYLNVLALPTALLLTCCGNADSAPGVAYDPSLDFFDAQSAPIQVSDAGMPVRPRDPRIVTIAVRSDAGKLDAAPPDNGPGIDLLDSGILQGDARAAEQGAFGAVERLLVADGKTARVHAFDVPSRSYLNVFNLSGPGVIYAGGSGRYGYVLESAQNLVQVISAGLPDPAQTSSPTLSAPSLLSSSFSGLSPSAFSAHGSEAAILFTGASQLAMLDEQYLGSGAPTRTLTLAAQSGAGVLLHLGDRLLVSQRDSATGESGLRLLDSMLAPLSRPNLSCAAPEAAALAQGTVAVGCSEGILLWDTTTTVASTLRYPASAAGQRVHKLAPSPAANVFLTVLGDQLCRVQADISCVKAPESGVIDFAFDAAGKRALVLTRDGTLHLLDGETLAPRATLALISTVPTSAPASELPSLAVGHYFAYVSDPSGSSIQIVDSGSAKLAGKLEAPGAFPTHIAVFNYWQ